MAAKPTPNYSITVDQPNPVFGDHITFTYSPDPVAGNIVLECSQNGVLVSSETHAANAEGWGYHIPFTLGGTYLWTSGAAEAVARLTVPGRGRKTDTVATASFTVGA